MSPQYGERRHSSGWDRLTSLGYPCKFQLVSRLGSVTALHLVVGVSQTLRRWTEGATYIWQGDHHVGHWPTFLVASVVVVAELSQVGKTWSWRMCVCKFVYIALYCIMSVRTWYARTVLSQSLLYISVYCVLQSMQLDIQTMCNITKL